MGYSLLSFLVGFVAELGQRHFSYFAVAPLALWLPRQRFSPSCLQYGDQGACNGSCCGSHRACPGCTPSIRSCWVPRSALTRLAASSPGLLDASPAASSASDFPRVRLPVRAGASSSAQSQQWPRTNLPAPGCFSLCSISTAVQRLLGPGGFRSSSSTRVKKSHTAGSCILLVITSTLSFLLFPGFLGKGGGGE